MVERYANECESFKSPSAIDFGRSQQLHTLCKGQCHSFCRNLGGASRTIRMVDAFLGEQVMTSRVKELLSASQAWFPTVPNKTPSGEALSQVTSSIKLRAHSIFSRLALLGMLVVSSALFGVDGAIAQTSAPDQPAAQRHPRQTPIPPTRTQSEAWRATILKAPRPKKDACYTAAYPEKTWREVPCKPPTPTKPYLPRHQPGPGTENVGNTYKDITAQVPDPILEAEGSFDSVTGATSESSPSGQNAYSLQLNTNTFATTTCKGSVATQQGPCQGWEQFVYSSQGTGGIQYWLENYGPSGASCPAPQHANCPGNLVYSDGWCPFSVNGAVDCAVNGVKRSGPDTAETVTSLPQIKITGSVAGFNGNQTDAMTITTGNVIYSAPGNNYFPDLGNQWQTAEFNVFGDGSSDQASFNTGSTIVVRTSVSSKSTSVPTCFETSFTGETNNLTVVNLAPPVAHSGTPSVVFKESNAPGSVAIDCSGAVSVGDTHLTTFDGLYYDFQASGDFVLAQDGTDFVVQTRQVSGAPTWPNASVNKAVAIQVGKTRVALYIEPVRLVIDGTPANLEDGKTIQRPTGVQIRRQGNVYLISSRSGNSVSAALNSGWIDVNVRLVVGNHDKVNGLLGNPYGNGKELVTSRGVVLKEPVSFQDLYHTYADSWRVQPGRSLFGNTRAAMVAIPSQLFHASDLNQQAADVALANCKAEGIANADLLDSCALDTVVLQDKTAARAFVNPLPIRHFLKPIAQRQEN